MKNIKIKTVALIVLLLTVSFASLVYATNAFLYVSPVGLNKNVGDIFNASVGFNTSGNKVCAAEGTLVFNNLSCQSISVANGLMTQTLPTCSNPHFLIGVPNCTMSDKILFTTSVKTKNAGMASINITGVDLIGEGSSVGSASIVANYTINKITILKQEVPLVQQNKITEKLQKDTSEEQDNIIAANLVSKETDLEASALKAIEDNSQFNRNIIWVVVLIIGIVISFIAGRMNFFKKYKK